MRRLCALNKCLPARPRKPWRCPAGSSSFKGRPPPCSVIACAQHRPEGSGCYTGPFSVGPTVSTGVDMGIPKLESHFHTYIRDDTSEYKLQTPNISVAISIHDTNAFPVAGMGLES